MMRRRTPSPGRAIGKAKAKPKPGARASATGPGRAILSKFLLLDINGDGVIERHDLAEAMMHIDADIWTPDRVDAMMSLIDKNEDGKIQCAEFVDWALDTGEHGEAEALFRRALDELPALDSGYWRVVAAKGVNVRDIPSASSAKIGMKSCYDVVRGREVGEWLMLSDEPGFMLVASATGAMLEKCEHLSGVDAELSGGRHLLFVYGTLRKGFHNNHFMDGAEFQGDSTTASWYRMFARDPKTEYHSSLPFVAAHNEGAAVDAPEVQIHGEVYAVSSEQLAMMDGLEGHPDWYHRAVVFVHIGGRCRPCWLYFNEKDMLDVERLVAVPSGDFRDMWDPINYCLVRAP